MSEYEDLFDSYDIADEMEEDNEYDLIEVLGESDKAVLILTEDGTAWFPKSVITHQDDEVVCTQSWFTPNWED